MDRVIYFEVFYGLHRNLYNNNYLNRVHNGVSMLELFFWKITEFAVYADVAKIACNEAV